MSEYKLGIVFDAKTGQFRTNVKQSRKSLTNFNKSAKETSVVAGKMGQTIARAGTALAGVFGASALVKGVSSTTREFQILKSTLHTATGSVENANIAFAELQKFAASTPFSVKEATSAFIKLQNLGLTPSKAALESYGNTASAMGKSLDQLIEAVADASVAEFERLKEFGIKAKNQGDTIAFTFRGIKTEVSNNAQAIEGYLQNLGKNEFGGAMERQAQTFDGALSNMGDSWDNLKLTISEAGVGDAMEDAVRGATDILDELTARITSGRLAAEFGAISTMYSDVLNEMIVNGNNYSKANAEQFSLIGKYAQKTIDFISDTIAYFPVNIHALIKIGVAEIDNLIREAKIKYLNFRLWFNEFTGDDEEAGLFRAQLKDLTALDKRMDDFKSNYVSNVLAERDAAIQSFEEQIAAAQKLGEVKAGITSSIPTTPTLPSAGSVNQSDEQTDPLAKFKLSPDKVEEQKGYWDQLAEHMRTTSDDFDTMWGNTFDRFAQGIGDATATSIMEGENFGDAMKNIGKSVIKEVISGLVQIGVKKLALFAIEKTINKGSAAGAAGVMTANAGATSMQAGLAAFASTAAIPIVGPALAPGAMTAALAITSPMVGAIAAASGSMVGMAHDGIDEVPREGTWLLDKGERVVDNRTNQDLKQALKNGGMSGAKITVNLIEDAARAGQVSQGKGLNNEDVIRIFVANVREGGDSADALELTYGLQRTGT